MARALKLKATYMAVSVYELGTRKPSLLIVPGYARLAGVSTDVLTDDKLDWRSEVAVIHFEISRTMSSNSFHS